MTLTVEAIYENGVLKPAQPLPLEEHETVRITIEPQRSWAERTAGLLEWTGDPEVLRRIAEDDEFGIAGVKSHDLRPIPAAAAVFLDANTLVYHFVTDPSTARPAPSSCSGSRTSTDRLDLDTRPERDGPPAHDRGGDRSASAGPRPGSRARLRKHHIEIPS